MANILISVPNTGWVHKACAFTLLKLQQEQRHRLQIIMPTHNPFENNLHHIVKDFLAGDYDYWLSFDADNPPSNNPLDLVALNKDIIGLPTPVWHYTGEAGERPIYWNAYKKRGDAYLEWPVKAGLQEVDAVGTGCFLVARRVFENKAMQRGAFSRKLHPDGRVNKGNDLSFCERAKEQGFKVYTHYGYPCKHFKELELTEVIGAMQGIGS